MLSRDNANLVRRDPAIPGLGKLLDPDAFVAELQPQLPETRLDDAELTYIRYKPATNCLVSYRLQVNGRPVDITAKAFGPGALRKLRKVRDKGGVESPLGPGRFCLENMGAVVSVFPNDGKLETLRCLCETNSLQGMLQTIFPDQPELWNGTVRTLRYNPERRHVARLDRPFGPRAVLKFYRPRAFPIASTCTTQIASRGELHIPACIGSSAGQGLLAFQWINGAVLSHLLYEGSHGAVGAATLAGGALTEIHRQEGRGMTFRSRYAEATKLYQIAGGIAILAPHLAEWAERLASRLAGWLLSEPEIRKPVHGDFYAKQILVNNDRVHVIDFDEACLGDPRADLGLFIAHLERDLIGDRLLHQLLNPVSEALVQGYVDASGQSPPRNLNVYTAIGLFQLAHHPFRRFEPDWSERIEQILERVETNIRKPIATKISGSDSRVVLAEKRPCGPPVSDPFDASKDPKMPFLAHSLDPDEAETILEELFHDHGWSVEHFRILRISVTRYKPGRRCIVEYDVEIRKAGNPMQLMTILGKARTKGPDLATYHLCKLLRMSNFGDGNPDGIGVPEPFGVIPEQGMWFQHKVPGTVSTDLFLGPDGIPLSRRIAEAVHKLHNTEIPHLRSHDMADELRILRQRLNLVQQTFPVWEERLERILVECRRLGSSCPNTIRRGIHRDFYSDHVVVSGSKLYLVDLDLFCEGDPALDVGNFAAHMIEYGLRSFGDPNALEECREALVARYLDLAADVALDAIEAYTTLSLVRHIYLSTQFLDRRPFTKTLLELCEQRLGLPEKPSSAKSVHGQKPHEPEREVSY